MRKRLLIVLTAPVWVLLLGAYLVGVCLIYCIWWTLAYIAGPGSRIARGFDRFEQAIT